MIMAITIITAGTAMLMTSSKPDHSWLYRTLSWMSPAWPIGSFAFSGGLEWAHDAGWLDDCEAVQGWLRESLECGSLQCEALTFVHGWQATPDADAMRALADLAMAAQGSAERALEASAQGSAFRRIALAANRYAHPAETAAYKAALAGIADDALPFALAASALFATFHVPLDQALTGYLHAALANLVSAAQRIVPLGHTEAQMLMVWLEPAAATAVTQAIARGSIPLELSLSSATLAADIACMAHETQYTRLFRT